MLLLMFQKKLGNFLGGLEENVLSGGGWGLFFVSPTTDVVLFDVALALEEYVSKNLRRPKVWSFLVICRVVVFVRCDTSELRNEYFDSLFYCIVVREARVALLLIFAQRSSCFLPYGLMRANDFTGDVLLVPFDNLFFFKFRFAFLN
jgi:hypothetical protein